MQYDTACRWRPETPLTSSPAAFDCSTPGWASTTKSVRPSILRRNPTRAAREIAAHDGADRDGFAVQLRGNGVQSREFRAALLQSADQQREAFQMAHSLGLGMDRVDVEPFGVHLICVECGNRRRIGQILAAQ